MKRLIEERVTLCEVKRIPTKPLEGQLVRKRNPIKVTQKDVDDLNRKIRKDVEEARKRYERGLEIAKKQIMR